MFMVLILLIIIRRLTRPIRIIYVRLIILHILFLRIRLRLIIQFLFLIILRLRLLVVRLFIIMSLCVFVCFYSYFVQFVLLLLFLLFILQCFVCVCLCRLRICICVYGILRRRVIVRFLFIVGVLSLLAIIVASLIVRLFRRYIRHHSLCIRFGLFGLHRISIFRNSIICIRVIIRLRRRRLRLPMFIYC